MIERSTRLPCRFAVLAATDGETAEGTTVNLSESGALVHSPIRPRVGSLVRLTITARDKEHVAGGRIVRLAADGFAVQFLSNAETAAAVKSLLILAAARR